MKWNKKCQEGNLIMNCIEHRVFETIYHISDIHIRLYHRLNEYKEVFENLCSFLRTRPAGGLIVITGDILHHKNELSPECIVFTRDFLVMLAKIFPVAMIAGNHDALLNNQNRMDSLTAIVGGSSGDTNVFYLKNTGFYRFGNVVFGVSSLLDGQFLPASDYQEERTPGIRLVGLYHGGVGRFSTNKGFSMEGAPLSRFHGYDMTMLGDIHLFQYLDGETKRIAYSGSLISQNYTETDPNHGVLIWNVASGESHLHRIENPYAYCDAVLDTPYLEFRGKRSLISSALSLPLPSRGRLSVVLTRTKTADDKEALRSLSAAFPHLSIMERTVCRDMPSMSTTTTPSSPHTDTTDVMDPIEILRSYLETLPEDWDKESLFDVLKESCGGKTSEGGSTWEILRVEFDHMFGYGPGNVLEMKNLPLYETIGIFGDNSAGKSSLVEILVFLLYGQITRYAHGVSVPREVIHFREKKSRGLVRFGVQGIVYEIEKTMVLQKSGKIRVDEILRRIREDGSVEDLSEEHRRKTDKFIVSQIGTCQEFLFASVFLQQNEESFRGMSPKDRKEFLNRILDLDRFDAMHQEKNEAWKKTRRELEIVDKELDQLQSEEVLQERIRTEETTLEEIVREEDHRITLLESMEKERRELHGNRKTLYCTDPIKERQRLSIQKMSCQEELEMNRHRWLSVKSCVGEEDPETLLHQQWRELETLYRQRVGTPEIDPVLRSAMDRMGILETDSRHESSDVNLNLNVNIENMRTTKEVLMTKLEKDEMVSVSTKKLMSMREKHRAMLDGSPSDDMPAIEARLEALEDLGWRKKKETLEEKMRLLESTSDRMTRVVDAMCFREECDACDKNKIVLGDRLSMSEQRRALETERTSFLAEMEPIQKEIATLQVQWSDAKQRLLLRQELDAIEKALSSRTVRQEIADLEARIKTAERHREEEEVWRRLDLHRENIERARFMNQHMDEEIEKIKAHIQKIEDAKACWKKLQEAKIQLDEMDRELALVLQCIHDIEHNRLIDRRFCDMEREEKRMREAQRQYQERRVALSIHLQTARRELETRRSKKKVFDRSQKEASHLQQLLHVTGRDGFPMFMLSRFLPFLQEKLNEIVGPFLGERTLVLCSEKKKETVNIHLYMRSHDANTVYMGGMEGFIVDAALKIVFARVSLRPRCNLFLIDEGISVLDKKSMESLDQFFQFLEQFFPRVFVISHLREAQEFVRRSIHVRKTDGYSRLLTDRP
jgi:DNA repair exonuclease SbcCD ATPase subunit/DNA repair exonuclease SbcCD nuclease subunit